MVNYCRKELLYALIIMLTPFGFGYIICYPSPALPYFESRWKLSEFESTAFNAVSSLTAIFGPYLTSFLLGHFGRKIVTFILSVAGIIGWALLFPLNESIFWYGILIRAILGLIMGAFSAIGPLYLVEIAPQELTGFFGNFNQLAVVFSIIIMYILGEYKAPWTLNVLAIVTHALQCFLIWLVPETSDKQQKEENKDDYDMIKESICQKKYAKNIIIVISLMILQQFSGANAILTNLSSLFSAAGVPIRSGVAAAITMCAQLLAVFISGILVVKFGRKVMWVVSSSLCCVSLLIYALNDKFNWNNIIPIVMIFFYQFGFGLGIGPMPWYYVPELFPESVRSIASSINSMTSWIGSFAVIFIYPSLKDAIGDFGAFIFFGCVCIVSAVVGFLFIKDPENAEEEEEEDKGEAINQL